MNSRYLDSPAVLLDARACAVLDPLLVHALVDARRRDAVVSEAARQVAADVHQVAVRFRAAELARAGSATPRPAVDAEPPVWEAQTFSTAEAARIASVSSSFMRRVVARGEVVATIGHGGGYRIDAVSFAVWLADREERKAA